VLQRLRRLESILVRVESGLLVSLVMGMATLAFVQVARRQFFGTGAVWADTLLRHLVLWVGFLGAALAAADEKHFAWEAASHRGGPRAKAAAHAAAAVIAAVLAGVSVTFFADDFRHSRALMTIGQTPIPGWIFALAIPVGFSLVAAHSALRAAHILAEPR
jgi:TRAP-type C4-dicarboxylate transport system permease small subunit